MDTAFVTLRAAEQVNGREAKTATLFSLPTCVCFCPRHLSRYASLKNVEMFRKLCLVGFGKFLVILQMRLKFCLIQVMAEFIRVFGIRLFLPQEQILVFRLCLPTFQFGEFLWKLATPKLQQLSLL